jgi:hypothetical protein
MKWLLIALLAAAPALADYKRLYAEEAEASSFLKSNWNKYNENYHPSYILDDDPKTAWVEGVSGVGQGQHVEWTVSTIDQVRSVKLRIRNGYQKRKGLLKANGAPSRLEVELFDAKGKKTGGGAWDLKRKMGWQEKVFPVKGGFAKVKLTIAAVKRGTKYQDTCISDAQVLVDADVRYAASVEKRKREKLETWIKERKKTAAYFASLPKQYPFASTHFSRGRELEGKPAGARAMFEMPEGGQRVRVDHKSSAPSLPDGLPGELPSEFVDLSDTSLFETGKEWAAKRFRVVEMEDWDAMENGEEDPPLVKRKLRDWQRSARVVYHDEARTRPKLLWFEWIHDEEGRGGISETSGFQVLRFDESQRLVAAARVDGMSEIGTMSTYFELKRDAQGRVTEVVEYMEINEDPQRHVRYVATGET